jgi:hypothetical protein
VLYLNFTDAEVTRSEWNNTTPTNSVFSMSTSAAVNASGADYVAYLFATKSGISKVGSYAGNGTSQTIDCGFTTGARFIMIKRTDAPGDWKIYNSARGIIAGNDPTISLNVTGSEDSSYDAVDPDATGFIVNTNLGGVNVNAATYIYLAIA